jgi:DNA (cytosine-5)-methyltransferase 1
MTKLRVLDLFSGIGGFSLGLERTGGFETVAFCEIDPFCRRVLAKHWPDVPCFEDVTKLRGEDVGPVDVICGGFPCQDISIAGRREGIEGVRSGLWAEFARLIGEVRPAHVIVENVSNLLSGPSERPGAWFGRVLGDLAALGYDAEWHCIPAGAVGAPHIRDRIWVVAYPDSCDERGEPHAGAVRRSASSGEDQAEGSDWQRHRRGSGDSRQASDVANAATPRRTDISWGQKVAQCARLGAIGDTSRWQPEPAVGRVVDGLPRDMARWRKRSVEALGNAVVPQIPELIGRAILEARAA